MPKQNKFNAFEGMVAMSSISDGEIYAGFLARHRFRTKAHFAKQVYGSAHPSWALPTDLTRQTEILGDFVGSIDEVVARNTLLPGYTRFLTAADADKIRRHHVGEKTPSATFLVGLTGYGRPGHTWRPGICLECLDDDISPSSEPFWRRDFVLSRVSYCARHHAPIFDFCGNCFHGFRASTVITAPSKKCFCGSPLIQRPLSRRREERYIQLDIARGWSKFLDPSFLPDVQGPEIAYLMQKTAREMGLTGPRTVNWDCFHQYYSTPEFANVGSNLNFPFCSGSVRDALTGRTPLRNPFESLFLLITMFGAWAGVENALRSLQPGPPATNNHAKKPQQLSLYLGPNRGLLESPPNLLRSIELLPETIRLFKKLRSMNPLLSHTEIVSQLPEINQYAATEERMRAHGLDRVPAFAGRGYSAEVDEALAALIKQRWSAFVEAGAIFRLTATRLMNGYRMHKLEAAKRLPKAVAALAKYAETPRMRMLRVLKLELHAGLISGLSETDVERLHEIDEVTLLKFFQQRLKSRVERKSEGKSDESKIA
jgi:hypothetical protein